MMLALAIQPAIIGDSQTFKSHMMRYKTQVKKSYMQAARDRKYLRQGYQAMFALLLSLLAATSLLVTMQSKLLTAKR